MRPASRQSATKGVAAILAWLLAQGGVLDFDAPVTKYWPEFGGGGKSAVPVRYLFTHQVGLHPEGAFPPASGPGVVKECLP